MDKLEDEAKICYQREKRENTRDRYVIVFASYLIGWEDGTTRDTVNLISQS